MLKVEKERQILAHFHAYWQDIDFRPILAGELFGPLRDLALFNQVRIDPEIHTLVWPNGADFDPATLHDWQSHEAALRELAQRWELANA